MSGSYAVAAASVETTEEAPAPPGLTAMTPIGVPPAAMVAQYVEGALANRMQQIVATVTADVIGALTGQNLTPAYGPGGGGGPRRTNHQGQNQGRRTNNAPDPVLTAARERFYNEYCLRTEEQLCELAGTSTLDEVTFQVDVLVVPFDPDRKLKIVEGGREFSLVKFSRDFSKTLSKRVKDYYWNLGFDMYYTYKPEEGFFFQLTPNC